VLAASVPGVTGDRDVITIPATSLAVIES